MKMNSLKTMSELVALPSVKKEMAIIIETEDFAKIQHIVAEAKQEVQWFHQVERREGDGYVCYRLYNTWVPPQYVSAKEVETDGALQIEYYTWLEGYLGSSDKANEVLMTSTAWCHSHVNMSTQPSPQDNLQFKTQVENASLANSTMPQIMIIVNKQKEVFTRVYDPVMDMTYQNVPVRSPEIFDFAELDTILKANQRVKPVPVAEVKVASTTPLYQNDAHKSWNKNWSTTGNVTPNGTAGDIGNRGVNVNSFPVAIGAKLTKSDQNEIVNIVNNIKINPNFSRLRKLVISTMTSTVNLTGLKDLVLGAPSMVRRLKYGGWKSTTTRQAIESWLDIERYLAVGRQFDGEVFLEAVELASDLDSMSSMAEWDTFESILDSYLTTREAAIQNQELLDTVNTPSVKPLTEALD